MDDGNRAVLAVGNAPFRQALAVVGRRDDAGALVARCEIGVGEPGATTDPRDGDLPAGRAVSPRLQQAAPSAVVAATGHPVEGDALHPAVQSVSRRARATGQDIWALLCRAVRRGHGAPWAAPLPIDTGWFDGTRVLGAEPSIRSAPIVALDAYELRAGWTIAAVRRSRVARAVGSVEGGIRGTGRVPVASVEGGVRERVGSVEGGIRERVGSVLGDIRRTAWNDVGNLGGQVGASLSRAGRIPHAIRSVRTGIRSTDWMIVGNLHGQVGAALSRARQVAPTIPVPCGSVDMRPGLAATGSQNQEDQHERPR